MYYKNNHKTANFPTLMYAACIICALCVLATACGGGGGGGGGGGATATGTGSGWLLGGGGSAASNRNESVNINGGSGSWGGSGGSGKAQTLSFADNTALKNVNWKSMEFTFYVNGTPKTFNLSPENPSFDVSVKKGDVVRAEATILTQRGKTKSARSDTITVGAGNNPLTLYINYDITFKINAPTGVASTDIVFSENGGAEYSATYTTRGFNAPKITNTAYGFELAGWARDADGNVPFIASEPTDNIDVYAVWQRPYAHTFSAPIGSYVFFQGRTVDIMPFWICDHEVTQAEYLAVMGSNPSEFQGDDNPPDEGEVQDNRPVEMVNWYDALVYCNKRSIKEGFTPCYTINGSTNPDAWGAVPRTDKDPNKTQWDAATCNFTANGYRLPTEAEWEYAARGGNLTNNGQTTYAGSDTIDDVAWYSGNYNHKTHEVKKLAPNSLGLYDMSGNLEEWCWDWHGDINTNTPATGASSGSGRVLRGGGYWSNLDEYHAVSFRNLLSPYIPGSYIGFRVVRTTTE